MTNYKTDLLADLADPDYAAAYIDDALATGSLKEFLLSLRDVSEARKMSLIAEAANLNRENMYRMLSDSGNPRLSSLQAVLWALGLKLRVVRTQGAERLAPETTVQGLSVDNQATRAGARFDEPLRRKKQGLENNARLAPFVASEEIQQAFRQIG